MREKKKFTLESVQLTLPSGTVQFQSLWVLIDSILLPLKKVLVDSNIDSQAKQANTIISKLLEGIATRKVTVTNTELQIE